jgi:protein phosphatase PTC7
MGVDAGAYARQLMNSAADAADEACSRSSNAATAELSAQVPCDAAQRATLVPPIRPTRSGRASYAHGPALTPPQTILETAYSRTTVRGSSTACVAVLNGDRLAVSNLGDSGLLLLRAGAPRGGAHRAVR